MWGDYDRRSNENERGVDGFKKCVQGTISRTQ